MKNIINIPEVFKQELGNKHLVIVGDIVNSIVNSIKNLEFVDNTEAYIIMLNCSNAHFDTLSQQVCTMYSTLFPDVPKFLIADDNTNIDIFGKISIVKI